MKKPIKKNNKSQYFLSHDGSFVIENYNHTKPFSNFFPGIAGVWGIPMWVFYVNRGQCISSFGIESKDKAILEFQPANKAYRLTSLQGFRTFLKVQSGQKSVYWEPFQSPSNRKNGKFPQKMNMTAHDLTIEDINLSLGVSVKVHYFTLAEESFPALIRKVSITNLSKKKYSVEVIDGLPAIIPFGLTDGLNKNISRTVEAWVKVRNLENRAPFFHLNVEVSDKPQVTHIHEGNFYFSLLNNNKGNTDLLPAIVESSLVFGSATDYAFPEKFAQQSKFNIPSVQQTSNRTPCAMSLAKFTLSSGKQQEVVSAIGYAHEVNQLPSIIKKVSAKGYLEKKSIRNQKMIDEIKSAAFTSSSSKTFDLYCSQTYLDNVLRGGAPAILKTQEGNAAFHVFSRKHGDLERDYNYFVLAPTYFSQGNGNYRDVNQNRRNDIYFNRAVKENNIINFFNLIQADGYNPLVVKGVSFFIDDELKIESLFRECLLPGQDSNALKNKLKNGYQPGGLLTFIEQTAIKLKIQPQEFISKALSLSYKQEMADHGEGFWTDHWTYNIDLLERFFSVYPDELKALLLEKKIFSFYFNSHYVLGQSERYILTPNGIRQYHSVKNAPKETRAHEKGHKLRIKQGEGEVYLTALFPKLLCLIANKVATLDPSGVGVEMEGDKPNWYDALNGLPGLLGSSISESFEIKRLAKFLLQSIALAKTPTDSKISVFEELAVFIEGLMEILNSENNPAQYWKKSNMLKEQYRSKIHKGIEGKERTFAVKVLVRFLESVVDRIDRGFHSVQDSQGLFPTYFYHEVIKYDVLGKHHDAHTSYVSPKEFKRHDLPLFLEGFVHALRVADDQSLARKLYQKIRKSPLFDKKLKMYKVNADLKGESEEIGRTKIFPRGWLENESIWLHMEYKYLLEILRSGLYEEFYETFQDILIPFLEPSRYGRSTLENSSFIVSSCHEDESLHGQGFVARLSGSTAEFLHIWLLMNVGKNPFQINNKGELSLKFEPALAGWLFSQKESEIEFYSEARGWGKVRLPRSTYAFNFLGTTLVVYHNPKLKNTFGKNPARIQKIILSPANHSNTITMNRPEIPAVHCSEIREGRISRIDVHWG